MITSEIFDVWYSNKSDLPTISVGDPRLINPLGHLLWDNYTVNLDRIINQKETEAMKPLIICYAEQPCNNLQPSLHRYVERNLGAEISLEFKWTDLVLAVANKPVAIIFHHSVIESDNKFKQLLKKVNRLCMRLPKKINIGVYIGCDNSLEFVNSFESLGIIGIVPNPEDFGIDCSVEALRNIMNGKEHWPNDVLSCLPEKDELVQLETNDPKNFTNDTITEALIENKTIELPNIVYFKDDHSNSIKCTKTLSEQINCTWTMPSTWEQLTKELEAGSRTVATHIDMINKSGATVAEFVDMVTTLVKFLPEPKKLNIGVVITKNTPFKKVQELQQTSVAGLLLDLNDFNVEDVSFAVSALISGTRYWPEKIIKQLPGNKLTNSKLKGISLTERQTQIANLICKRGLSNKKVANMLDISESTVKAHVSAILKAYGVRNRTQLVLSVGNSQL